ncbi:DMT family transporter [Pseudomonas multiresinivorans]|uniref:DMT family transporter n=1 Tax=Pseudomonas multiresinivorans TaxID=95301 RepID=A0A7Z3GRQ2_9PSED|nr:DMT family transporter [Pseudomonas multiresinivorans]QJP09410.1 DMT family transporter [Pseudomonas multiresinivorans]
MKRGVVYAGMAGAIWGGVILAPSLVPEFNPLLISSVRFALYGAISLLVALPVALGLLRRVSREDLSMLMRLSLAGNLLYFALLSAAVQFAGVAAASLINGIMPLAIAYQSRSEHDSLPLSRMKLPLALVALGILCINLDPSALMAAGSTPGERILGIVCGFCGVACWSWYASANARYLKASHFNSHEWSTLIGVVTGVMAVILAGVGVLIAPQAVPSGVAAERWMAFLWVSLFLAVFGSWVANGLWNAATRRLPMSLGGQLIVFETLFACAYAYINEQRLPGPVEALAIVLLTVGVLWAIGLHRAPAQVPARAMES